MCPESSRSGSRPYEMRKRAQSMEATRQRITEAAVELHGSIGPAKTTISAVAEKAGVQRHTVYRHFPTEQDLFEACSGHFAQLHPAPDPGEWAAIADPAERAAVALDALYAWYEDTGHMWANVFRDETLVTTVTDPLSAFRGFMDQIADGLAAGWGARGARRQMLRAAARHAVDFQTWRSLARDGGLDRAQAVELAAAMIERAAGR